MTTTTLPRESLAGKASAPQSHHVFVVYSRANAWREKLEEDDASPVAWLSTMLKKHGVSKDAVRVTAVEGNPEYGDEEGDVLIFPNHVVLKRAITTLAEAETTAKFLANGGASINNGELKPVPLKGPQIMICSHTKRDERCGNCGPVLFATLEVGMRRTATGRPYAVRKCSHIGGHKYAGNVILFRPNESPTSGSTGDWLSYITPAECEALCEMCFESASGDAYPPHALHANWRGRSGISDDAHIELANKVQAACANCEESTRDIEDGVRGYPSPTVKDKYQKRLFTSPSNSATASSSTGVTPTPVSSIPAPTTAAAPPAKASPKPRVFFILGPPGTGKGTQCARLVRDRDLVHLSAGDLLREERLNPNSKHGKLIESCIKEGKIVPVAITVSLLWAAIENNAANGRRNFLVDGFPRNDDNLRGWNEVVGDKARVVGCLFLDAPEAVVEARLLERGKTSGRTDDNIESIRKRFDTYRRETRPIIDHFAGRGLSFRVDSSRTVDEVYAEVLGIVDEFVIPARRNVLFVLGGPGAGKGTQCERVSREPDWDCAHLSAGDLLREERADPSSKDGALIESFIKEGKIVPVEITVRLLLRSMRECGARTVLVDGFPRNLDNLQGWTRHAAQEPVNVLGVLMFDVPEAVMEARLLERGKTSGRSDDNIESIRKRFKTFYNDTMPIVEQYKRRGQLFSIDANRSRDAVYADVENILRKVGVARGGSRPGAVIATSTLSSSSTTTLASWGSRSNNNGRLVMMLMGGILLGTAIWLNYSGGARGWRSSSHSSR